MLGGVVQHVAEHLLQPLRVAGDGRQVLIPALVVQFDALLPEQLAVGEDGVLKLRLQVHLLHPEGESAVLHLGEFQQLLYHGREPPGLVQNDADAAAHLGGVICGVLQNRLAPAVDGSEGRPQLVGHGGDELGFHLLVLADLEGHIVDVVHQFPQLVRVLVFDLEAIAPGRDPLGRLRHHGHRLHHVVDEQQAGDQHQGHADASHRQNDKDHQDNLPVHQLHGRHQPHDARHPAVEQQGR